MAVQRNKSKDDGVKVRCVSDHKKEEINEKGMTV